MSKRAIETLKFTEKLCLARNVSPVGAHRAPFWSPSPLPGSIYYGSTDLSSGRQTSAHQEHGLFAQRRESLRCYGIARYYGFWPGRRNSDQPPTGLAPGLTVDHWVYNLPERAESVINHLQTHMGLSYVVSWSATSHTRDIW